ncbi:MAG: hypothetical protein EP329_15100 [Deltaproteobacteria bacterium]|nr:MAG: hypothetical protein EP329_15100 [Deltaproteobacteria bacterium]
MDRRQRRTALGIVLAVGLLLAGCGDEGTASAPEAYTDHAEASDFVDESGKADGTTSAWGADLVLTDAMYLDADQLLDADDIQTLLEDTPYGGRSWLADEQVGGESFAELLVRTARDYGMSPLVLLSRMQVEASLVAKTARPSDWLVDRAFGCGCYDGQPCIAGYLGLENQLACSAETFSKLYDASVDGSGAWRLGKQKKTLDGLYVTPRSHASAAMYAYTPWVLTGRGGNWLVRNITMKFARALGLAEGWIGLACEDSGACLFDHGGQAGQCASALFAQSGPSQCTSPCVGTCDDMPGTAPTFCVAVGDAGFGLCMPRAHAKNRQCAGLAGSQKVGAVRWVGQSGVGESTATVCAPTWLADQVAAGVPSL